MLIAQWNEVCYPLVSSLDTSWQLAVSQLNLTELLPLEFYLLLKRSLLLHRCCVLYRIVCPYLNNTWPFPHGKVHVLFFLKKLNKEVIKIQRHTWHPIPIFPTWCFGGGKSFRQEALREAPRRRRQRTGDSCWQSSGQEAAAEQWKWGHFLNASCSHFHSFTCTHKKHLFINITEMFG